MLIILSLFYKIMISSIFLFNFSFCAFQKALVSRALNVVILEGRVFLFNELTLNLR